MPAISIQFRSDRKTNPWTVRYADGPRHRSQSFRTKADAQVFAAQVRTEQATGQWISPDAGRVPLGQWADEWLAAYVGRAASTQASVRSVLRAHILPRFADRPLSSITRFDVGRMLNEMVASGRSPSTAEKALRVLSVVFAGAVDARLIRDNPCRGVRAPRAVSRHEPRFLTPGEVETLAACAPAPYDLLVRFAAYTGLRWGEVGAVQVADVDLLRGAVTVSRSLERRGTVKDTKTHSRRVVHLEAALAAEVAAHVQAGGLRPTDFVWTAPSGGPLSYTNFRRRVWRPAVLASGLDPALRFHDLRHTCASWLIARGGTARAVMAWMGHSTVRVTFDRYGHLFPHELEDLAASLADLRSNPDAFGRSPATLAPSPPSKEKTHAPPTDPPTPAGPFPQPCSRRTGVGSKGGGRRQSRPPWRSIWHLSSGGCATIAEFLGAAVTFRSSSATRRPRVWERRAPRRSSSAWLMRAEIIWMTSPVWEVQGL